MHEIKVTILQSDEIPGMAAYLSPSATEGHAIIAVNIAGLSIGSAIDCTPEQAKEAFAVSFKECLLHELVHVVQEIYGKAFSEAEVERLVAEGRKYLSENKDALEVQSQDQVIFGLMEENEQLKNQIKELEANNQNGKPQDSIAS